MKKLSDKKEEQGGCMDILRVPADYEKWKKRQLWLMTDAIFLILGREPAPLLNHFRLIKKLGQLKTETCLETFMLKQKTQSTLNN